MNAQAKRKLAMVRRIQQVAAAVASDDPERLRNILSLVTSEMGGGYDAYSFMVRMADMMRLYAENTHVYDPL